MTRRKTQSVEINSSTINYHYASPPALPRSGKQGPFPPCPRLGHFCTFYFKCSFYFMSFPEAAHTRGAISEFKTRIGRKGKGFTEECIAVSFSSTKMKLRTFSLQGHEEKKGEKNQLNPHRKNAIKGARTVSAKTKQKNRREADSSFFAIPALQTNLSRGAILSLTIVLSANLLTSGALRFIYQGSRGN